MWCGLLLNKLRPCPCIEHGIDASQTNPRISKSQLQFAVLGNLGFERGTYSIQFCDQFSYLEDRVSCLR